MKLAVISDIHGNLSALNAVLQDFETTAPDKTVLLGDVANFGPQPRETLARLRELDFPIVMGNTDASLLQPRTLEDVEDPDEDAPFFLAVEGWCAEQMTKEDLDFVRTFQPTINLEMDGVPLLLFHGSPRSYDDIIVATTPDAQLDEWFGNQNAQIMAGGHTHTQLLRRYRSGFLLNPGSVGLPFAYFNGAKGAINPHWAEYALVETVHGQPSVTFRRAPYDVAPLVEAARSSTMPYVDRWLSGWLRQLSLESINKLLRRPPRIAVAPLRKPHRARL